MSTPYFRFRQFTVWHDRCAMKVGTDGVLLGAWAGDTGSPAVRRVLDVGTGSGLVALMLAQRFPDALVEGIDIDPSAVGQAEENFLRSPFAERLQARCCPLQQWQTDGKYDLIASNPPYFSNALLCPDDTRTRARHNNMLPFADLLAHSDRLLADGGTLALVLPADAETEILAQARLLRLSCVRLCRVHTAAAKPAKRILLAFAKGNRSATLVPETLCLSEKGEPRSAAYSALTRDFYL
ncbi:MAG: tRNA1(Val) (adenine(37)-N6)-methyltransferase [Paludibacteraceae bacterium]